MWTAIKGLLGSKTFWAAIVGSALVTALSFILPHFGLSPELIQTIINWVGGLFGAKALQQGLADFGKSASS